MAKKKKTKKKATKSKTTASKKVTKRVKRPKKLARKKPVPKKAAKKKSAKKPARKSRARAEVAPFSVNRPDSRFGGQSGDLQGLSNVERADSESVDELLEEGNSFEAEVLSGVEDAGARAEREVHTREVPEDDVPGEYLDEE
jgi:hypothetical protein